MKFWLFAFALFLALGGADAQAARRLGGGKSLGKQSGNVTQRESTPGAVPVAPTAPAQGMGSAATKPAPAVATPAPAPRRPWGAMLGGLAAGLGLAWLAHSLGFGEGLGQILLFALLVCGVVVAIGWLRRRRANSDAVPPGAFAFQGAGSAGLPSAQAYRPENVGNDASARPWERSSIMPIDAVAAQADARTTPALAGQPHWGIPAGFDTAGFLQGAKSNFVALQAAWDRSDIPALRAMMTDDMLREIQSQLAERELHTVGLLTPSEVVMVEAHLLGIEELPEGYMASVEFSGMMREESSAGPSPFREVWNLTRARSGTTGWLVAGVQALQ